MKYKPACKCQPGVYVVGSRVICSSCRADYILVSDEDWRRAYIDLLAEMDNHHAALAALRQEIAKRLGMEP